MDEQDQGQQDSVELSGQWSARRILGSLLLFAVGIAAVYVIVGSLAWQSGQTLRTDREQAQRIEQIDRQVALAQDDIRSGSYNLALRRLSWILERDPGNSQAVALQKQAQEAIRTSLTPVALPTNTPISKPTAVVIVDDIADPVTELERLQDLAEREQWLDLLPAALSFQREFPNFERQESDELLYHAYLNVGLQQLQNNEIEQGLWNLKQAEQLGNLPQEALDYWLWADLYLEGIAYYGVNWGVSSSVFRDLCLSAPFFQDACGKLYDSLVNYAVQYLFNQDYCPAVDLLREARRYGSDAEVSDKLTEAVEGCSLATATPEILTGTVPLTITEPLPLSGTE